MRLPLMLPAVVALTTLFGAETFAAPVVVACGRGQHTVVRDVYARGRMVTRVQCVGGRAYPVYRTRYVSRYRHDRRHRSWGKSALVIGGSAATGAGVGGIVHGRNGALIGSAIGGGVASLYEGAHRR
jgi:hypothetical protein